MSERNLDCIVIGYNETPFDEYETLLRKYGDDSEAYRDLKFSFIDLEGKKLNYVGLLNHVSKLAHPGDRAAQVREELKSSQSVEITAGGRSDGRAFEVSR